MTAAQQSIINYLQIISTIQNPGQRTGAHSGARELDQHRRGTTQARTARWFSRGESEVVSAIQCVLVTGSDPNEQSK